MYAKATTTISILRGLGTADEFGDQEPTGTAKYTKVPASIIDRSATVAAPNNPIPIVLTKTWGRVGSETDIQYDDMIKDERSGQLYQVLNVGANRNPFQTPDIILELSRVSNYGDL